MSGSELRNIIDPELLEVEPSIKIVAETQFNTIVQSATKEDRTKSPRAAKDIVEVMEIIRQAILDCEKRQHLTESAKIEVVYEKPRRDAVFEGISIGFTDRTPGMYGQGRPMENRTQNRRPILRELMDDPVHPGYKRAILGYYYDNILRLTCWARTNKQANERAIWLENMMEEYTWFFGYSGINRLLFEGWRPNEVLDIENNIYYGRPIEYYVRTEKLWNLSQKTLEQIIVRLAYSDGT
jgi:hypothetical protein